MKYFVPETSIVRKIWSKADTILFIFGGAAAEFALNKSVDWLYFTGKLPEDPIGRLFSTVVYSHRILFQPEEKALLAIKSITQIHKNVEAARGAAIPDWAYRDVLFMLIHYSIAAFELLERKLSTEEKEEICNVFLRVGNEMKLNSLPGNYAEWLRHREEHLDSNLAYGPLTKDLFLRYRQHLGPWRYKILLQVQALLAPWQVNALLKFSTSFYSRILLFFYKPVKHFSLFREIKFRLLPAKYQQTLRMLECS